MEQQHNFYANNGGNASGWQNAYAPMQGYAVNNQNYYTQEAMPQGYEAQAPMYANAVYAQAGQYAEHNGFKARFTQAMQGIKSIPSHVANGAKNLWSKIKPSSQPMAEQGGAYAPHAQDYAYDAQQGVYGSANYAQNNYQHGYVDTQAEVQPTAQTEPLYKEIYPTTEVIIMQSQADCPEMIRRLNSPFISIINMEELPEAEYRTAFNILLGAKLALRYNLLKCGRGIFLLAPAQVTIGMNDVTRGIVEKLSHDNRSYQRRRNDNFEARQNPFPMASQFGTYR